MKDYLYTSKSDVWGFGVSLSTCLPVSPTILTNPLLLFQEHFLNTFLPPGADVGAGNPRQLPLSWGDAREVRLVGDDAREVREAIRQKTGGWRSPTLIE